MSTTLAVDANTRQLLLALASLNRRLKGQVERQRREMDASVREDLLGLFVTDAEIDNLLLRLDGFAACGNGHVSMTCPGGPDFRLTNLAELFGLGPFEQMAVLLGLAPEIDPRYERVYGYLHNDVTRKWPSIGLALSLFCAGPAEAAGAREVFHPNSSPRRFHLIMLETGESGGLPAPWPSRAYRLDDRVASFLLGQDCCDPSLDRLVSITEPEPEPTALPTGVSAEDARSIDHLIAHSGAAPVPIVVLLSGEDEHLKRGVARSISGARERPLVEFDARGRPDRLPMREAIERAFREARLRHGDVYLSGFDDLRASEPQASQAVIDCAGASNGSITLLSSAVPWEQVRIDSQCDVQVLSLAFPAPDYSMRVAGWRQHLPDAGDDRADDLAARFRLTSSQVAAAVGEARGYALLRGEDQPGFDDLSRAARAQSNQALGRLATKLHRRHGWDDLILPPAQLEQLHAIASQLRHRHTVLDEWGFGERIPAGNGVTALFAGPSGTGKTMAAGIVASSLELDLYRIDLSAVVSKYIGETEKNLSQIFHEAESANAVLFFDEADALFGKRSEVKDAHDRYANIEVAYLLQRMEEFDGLAILGTNLREHIDAAFARRLQFVITFPFPEAPERREIWKGHLPDSAPLASDVDTSFLASLPLSGGNIRNCALAAAYMAAAAGSAIGMEHLARAAARELRKLGRPVLQSQFGGYYRFAHGDSRGSVHDDP